MAGNITSHLLTKTVTIDSNLSGKEYTFVNYDTTDDGVVNGATDASALPLVLVGAGDGSTTPTEGTIVLGGVTKIKLGGTVTAGASLTATTGGVAIATTTDGDRAGGFALKGGSSGDIIEFLVAPHFVYTV